MVEKSLNYEIKKKEPGLFKICKKFDLLQAPDVNSINNR